MVTTKGQMQGVCLAHAEGGFERQRSQPQLHVLSGRVGDSTLEWPSPLGVLGNKAVQGEGSG